nr:MAG TPA: DNA directed DNA polymerase [Caudoviricetes sp.]
MEEEALEDTGEEESISSDSIFKGETYYSPLQKRRITEATCCKYGYRLGTYHGETVQLAPYCDDTGKEVGFKVRGKGKEFRTIGKIPCRFFGQHLFSGGRKLVITEGEIDCLTVSQAQGNKYPVVSLPQGAQSAKKTIKENLNWLSGFEEVILMFDMDEPGRKASTQCSSLLPQGQVKIATLPRKDPSECLMNGDAASIISAIWNAAPYRPDGILNPKDEKEKLLSSEEGEDSRPYPFPWNIELNQMTGGGMRKGELLLMTAGTGIGKSTAAREIAYHLKMHEGCSVGMLMLEENPKKTMRDLLSIHREKPLHLMWTKERKTKATAKAFDAVFGDGKFLLYDHFGSLGEDRLLSAIRYMIVGEGCDFVILDHISIAVSALETSGGDERKTIDVIMTKLRSLVEETGAGIIVISHLRKPDSKQGNPFEQGGKISLDDLRGSGSLKQLPDTIIALERNQQADVEGERNLLSVRLLKCRFTGQTGLAGHLMWNSKKNRITVEEASLDLPSQSDKEKEEQTKDTTKGSVSAAEPF